MSHRFSNGDPAYLRDEQYADTANLDARVTLHERFSTNPGGYYEWVFDRLEIDPRAAILEVGCGPAYLWRRNLERIPSGWRLTLADFSPGMVDAAAAAIRDPRFTFACFDAQAIPGSRRFDAVIANHMLYHVPDLERALRELRRVLDADGRLFATTNGRDHLRELSDLVVDVAGGERHDLEFAERFGIDTGETALARVFERVRFVPREDGLAVTEFEPILAFMQASWDRALFDPDTVAALRERVESVIRRDGAFHITKSVGIFIADGG